MRKIKAAISIVDGDYSQRIYNVLSLETVRLFLLATTHIDTMIPTTISE